MRDMSQEIAGAFMHMSTDMGGKLSNYYHSLQARYGDPEVYAAQRQEMAEEQAAVAHAQSKTREGALQAAYEKNRGDARSTHSARLNRRARNTPLESASPGPTDPPARRTQRPPKRASADRTGSADDPP